MEYPQDIIFPTSDIQQCEKIINIILVVRVKVWCMHLDAWISMHVTQTSPQSTQMNLKKKGTKKYSLAHSNWGGIGLIILLLLLNQIQQNHQRFDIFELRLLLTIGSYK